VRLLFVCTGNLCRSPIAERLATAWLREVGANPQGPDGVHIGSAGLQAPDGEPMDPHSAAALIELGGDPSGFRSRPMTPALADDADLVLTMTRRQRRATLEMTPRGLRRTFTLKEAADLLTSADLSGLDRMPAGERARQLGLRLDAERAWRAAGAGDDIRDPIGRRTSVHHQVADAIATALRPLTDVLVRGVPASQPR
jgi:low molecular weight protein-tyrosine phosphatase